ncbi:MAG: T9SS type A sorting domain-containing protein [Saprospiraceae bacterium]|nr:T9SS type A sorting domain-containing protein [Saprospiraceae bacterium]
MKNIFTFLFVCAVSLTAFAQFTEDFEGDISGTWSLDAAWVQGTTTDIASQYFNPPAHTKYISVNDDGAGNGVNLSGYAISPLVTVPADMNAVTFQYFFIDGDYQGNDETAKVLVSTDGVNFAEIGNLAASIVGGQAVWVDGFALMSEYAGLDVYIAFGYDDGQGWNYGFCIDDIAFAYVPDNVVSITSSTSSCLESTFVGNTVDGFVSISNTGIAALTDIELAVTVDGTTENVTVSGLNVAGLGGSTRVDLVDLITTTAGTSNVTVEIVDVNGGSDNGSSDVTSSFSVTGYELAENRGVFVEEATGTWCTWCPRGGAFMDLLKECFDQHFIGVAVHNNDPMVDNAYDAGIGELINGYPSAVFERNEIVDPSELIAPVLARAQEVAPATLRAGATNNGGLLTLAVEVQANVDMDGSYKLIGIITEDGVTGTSSGYAQVNAYSGSGAAYPLDWYSAQPSPVPASEMVYNEVGRGLIGGFEGETTTVSIAAGESFTHYFAATDMPNTIQDNDNVYINFVLLDASGSVINAWKQGYQETLDYVLSAEETVINVESVKVSPNPTAADATLTLTLEKASDVAIDVVNVSGKLVSTIVLNNQNGVVTVPVSTVGLVNGMYFVNVKAGNTIVTKRLVVNK